MTLASILMFKPVDSIDERCSCRRFVGVDLTDLLNGEAASCSLSRKNWDGSTSNLLKAPTEALATAAARRSTSRG